MSKKERLEQLRISESEFELYKDLFLKYRRRDTYAELQSNGSWPQFKYRWDDSLILRHLCAVTCVAIPFARRVDQIVLDIDHKSGRRWEDVEKTVRLAAQAIPGEPIIYQSSGSRGIRMIWFLTKILSRAALCEWAKNTLSKAGLEICAGKCEVRLGKEPDRLPFGRESMLLDPITLEPRLEIGLSETLAVVRDHREHLTVNPPIVQTSSEGQSDYGFRQLVRVCLDTGLPPDVTTNECLMKLAWHWRAEEGLEKEEIKCRLTSWITDCHNGNSNRVNNGKIEVVYNQIDRIVDELRVQPGERCLPFMHVGLSRAELDRLLEFNIRFKTASALFRVLGFSKAKLLSRLSTDSLRATLSQGRKGTNKWGKLFSGESSLPSGARNFKLFVDLSKALLRALRVPNSNNPALFIDEMQRVGVLTLKRKAWPAEHKARQYWVNFEFDTDGEQLEGDFDQVLWDTIGYDGIRTRFGRYQAGRIAEETSERPGDTD